MAANSNASQSLVGDRGGDQPRFSSSHVASSQVTTPPSRSEREESTHTNTNTAKEENPLFDSSNNDKEEQKRPTDNQPTSSSGKVGDDTDTTLLTSTWRTANGDTVSIKAVKAMALWSLKVGTNETCPICRESLQSLCVQCCATGAGSALGSRTPKVPSATVAGGSGGGYFGSAADLAVTYDAEDCRVCQLPCGHLFHYHCVSGWLQSRDQPCCPTCQAAVYSREDIHFL